MSSAKTEARHRRTENRLAAATARRAAAVETIARETIRIKNLERQVERQQRARERSAAAAFTNVTAKSDAAPSTTEAPAPQANPPLSPKASKAVDPDMPDFLRRRAELEAEGRAKDAAAAQQLRDELAQRGKVRARNQKERRDAKRTGDSKAMPLTGKAALASL